MPAVLRFVAGTSLVSKAIILQSKTAMPFTPSHVEVLSEDGKSYIGAHLVGGIQARAVGYDKDEVSNELLLTLDTTPDQDTVFHAFMVSKIGEPYDLHAILGFIIPEHFHKVNTAICSAVATLALRACGYFEWPVAVPAHLISPRDLLLMVSTRMKVPGI